MTKLKECLPDLGNRTGKLLDDKLKALPTALTRLAERVVIWGSG